MRSAKEPSTLAHAVWYGCITSLAWMIVCLLDRHLTTRDLGTALKIGLVGSVLTALTWPLRIKLARAMRGRASS